MVKFKKLSFRLSYRLQRLQKDESMQKFWLSRIAVNIKLNIPICLQNSEMNPFTCNFSNMR